jgi:hypothetical protein
MTEAPAVSDRAIEKAPADEIARNKGGRPRTLNPDPQTLKQLTAWSSIMCTEAEAAAVLGVSINTFKKFLADCPEARAAFDDGRGQGRMSLRRKQFALAEKNAAVAIFLGKNYLGQSDRQDHQHTGAGGGPIQHQVDLSALSDEELALLDAIHDKLAAAASAPDGGQGGDSDEGGEG